MIYERPDDFLAHHGVKGMKWGVRKQRTPGVSRKTDRAARRDAREFTQAKMYYGEGAGNRRKLIKAKVKQRSTDAAYKKAFDNHVSNTDWEKRAQQARGKRHRQDVKNSVGKTARGIRNLATGNTRYVGTAVLAGALAFKGGQAAGVFPSNSEIASKAIKAGRSGYEAVANSGAMRRMMNEINIYNGRRKFNKQFG